MIIREDVDGIKSQSGHASLVQSELCGVIATKYQDLVHTSENRVSDYELEEDPGQHEEVCVLSLKNGTTIDLTVISAYDTISVDNIDDGLVL